MVTSIDYAAAQTITYRIERQYRLVLNDKEKEVIASLIKSSKLTLRMFRYHRMSSNSMKLHNPALNWRRN